MPRVTNASDIATRLIRGGLTPDPTTGAIVTPIYQTTTFVQDGVGKDRGFTYSRCANPTVAALENALGSVENAPPAVCFATGLAAINTLFTSLLRTGDHVVLSEIVYGGTVRLLRRYFDKFGVTFDFVDATDPENIRAAITPATKLVFIESPGNPTLKLVDVAAVSAITRKAGVLLAIDNTFLTPLLQDCFALGADIIVYSTTKYIEGHNTTVGGALLTHSADLLEEFRLCRGTLGCIQSPTEAAATIRGIKTLGLRMKAHSENALTVARWLESQTAVASVSYPFLESFPQYELAKRQQSLGGGMLAFELKGGTEAGITLLNSLELCSLAENLGAVETLVTHPATMTHGYLDPDERNRLGITDGLVRLSVGLESPDDIIADLAQALKAAAAITPASASITTHPTPRRAIA